MTDESGDKILADAEKRCWEQAHPSIIGEIEKGSPEDPVVQLLEPYGLTMDDVRAYAEDFEPEVQDDPKIALCCGFHVAMNVVALHGEKALDRLRADLRVEDDA